MSEIEIPAAFRFLWSDKADDGEPIVYRAVYGGRGSGKSMNIATALVLKGAVKSLKILCAREIQGSIKDSVKAEIEAAIDRCGLGAFYDILEYEIRGKNGTLFIFSGLRSNSTGKNSGVNSIKSKAGIDICWVEEASAVSQVSLTALDATIRQKGSEVWFSWNPDKSTDPVDVMFCGEQGPPPGSIVRRVNYDDNPFFGETSLVTKMERDRLRDPDKYAHVWLGKYQRASATRVFRNWQEDTFDTPEDAVFRFGADWGFAVDPTVLIRGFIGRFEAGVAIADTNGHTLFLDAEAYKVGCEIDETPALFAGDCPPGKVGRDGKPMWLNPALKPDGSPAGERHPGIPGALTWLITADSSRPETVSYMKRHGFKIVGAIKGPGSVEDGINFLKSYDIVVHSRCKNTIQELTLYSWKTDPLTGQILPLLADKDNHLIDALRYAVEALRRAKAPIKPEGSDRKPRTDYKSRRDEGGDEWMAA